MGAFSSRAQILRSLHKRGGNTCMWADLGQTYRGILAMLRAPAPRPPKEIYGYLSSATVARYKPSGEKHTDLSELMWTSLSSMVGSSWVWLQEKQVSSLESSLSLTWGRSPKCHGWYPIWEKMCPSEGSKCLEGAGGLLALPCANFLMQSRSVLILMPQYKRKVFFRLRYMIIIGLPIICFIKPHRQKKKVDQLCENMKIHIGNDSFGKMIVLNSVLQLLLSGNKESLWGFIMLNPKRYKQLPKPGDMRTRGLELELEWHENNDCLLTRAVPSHPRLPGSSSKNSILLEWPQPFTSVGVPHNHIGVIRRCDKQGRVGGEVTRHNTTLMAL